VVRFLLRGLTATQLADGFGLLGAQALSGRIEASFRRRLESRRIQKESVSLSIVSAASEYRVTALAADSLACRGDASA
jgi:hypothetical protein